MNPFQLPEEIQDRSTYDRAVVHLQEAGYDSRSSQNSPMRRKRSTMST